MTSSFFTVLPGHDLAYNEIVKPTRRWAFSYYFLYRWLPLLHPQQAMLIQVLRQSTWQQGKPTGRCQLANATLCRQMGWATSSHKTLLAELERPLSEWFITRERTRKRHVTEGHAVEGAPRYRVLMDDPLTPADQTALFQLLSASRPATPYEAAEILAGLAKERSRELWARLDGQPRRAPLSDCPLTVAQIARAAWPHLPAEALAASRPFAESAEQCHLRLTGAGYAHMELDYLLRSWLPHLGIANTWLVIALRARCFHDPATGETRDVVMLSRQELEAQLGIPNRSFRRLLRDDLTLPLFHIAPADAAPSPDTPRTLPHRGELAFHVAYPLLPICPTDRAQYETLLLGSTFSTKGQPTRLETANEPIWTADPIHTVATNPAETGQATPLPSQEGAKQPRSKRTPNPAEQGIRGQATPLKVVSQPTILPSLTTDQLLSEQELNPPQPLGRGETEAMTLIRDLLAPFHIQGLNRILQNHALSVAEVRGWIYRGREEVAETQMGGYLFRRLHVGRTPTEAEGLPPLYLQAGEVDEAEAQQFEAWWLEELAPPPFYDGTQRARYQAWLQVVKREAGNPERPDFSPHARWRREMVKEQAIFARQAR